MNPPDDLTSLILASLAMLPEHEQNGMHAAINRAIKQMSIYRILELRQRVETQFDPQNPAVRATLNVINGQIVLREIAGTAHWR